MTDKKVEQVSMLEIDQQYPTSVRLKWNPVAYINKFVRNSNMKLLLLLKVTVVLSVFYWYKQLNIMQLILVLNFIMIYTGFIT